MPMVIDSSASPIGPAPARTWSASAGTLGVHDPHNAPFSPKTANTASLSRVTSALRLVVSSLSPPGASFIYPHSVESRSENSANLEKVGALAVVSAFIDDMESIDAIVVPAWRPASGLVTAIKLAQSTNTPLVVLCSGQATAADVSLAASAAGVSGVAVDLPRGYLHPLLDFASATHPAVKDARFTDVRTKRNIALLLAHMNGWRRLFFLDDDHVISSNQFISAENALREHRVAAFRADEFPDNSVVRHAERLAGGYPPVALSIGSAAVRVDDATTFFPEVYNEDWLFMYDGSTVAAGTIRQLPYDPFADHTRAEHEEFGDVLAEGLVQFRNAGLFATEATVSDWAAVLDDRARMIRDIEGRLLEPDALPARQALEAAGKRLEDITPQSLTSFVAVWRHDVERWQQRMEQLVRTLSVSGALEFLGLRNATEHFRAGRFV